MHCLCFQVSDDDEDGCSWTAAGNYCFGKGEFCGEEDPNLVAMEVIKPQRPGAAPTGTGQDGGGAADVPPIGRGGIHMLDRTFRGISGGSRHYPEVRTLAVLTTPCFPECFLVRTARLCSQRPLTAEEVEIAALELEQQEEEDRKRVEAEERGSDEGDQADDSPGQIVYHNGPELDGWGEEEEGGFHGRDEDDGASMLSGGGGGSSAGLSEESDAWAAPLPTYQC